MGIHIVMADCVFAPLHPICDASVTGACIPRAVGIGKKNVIGTFHLTRSSGIALFQPLRARHHARPTRKFGEEEHISRLRHGTLLTVPLRLCSASVVFAVAGEKFSQPYTQTRSKRSFSLSLGFARTGRPVWCCMVWYHAIYHTPHGR